MSQPVRSFKDLLVWQKSMRLVKLIYHLCCEFPDGERFGLTTQLQRAAVSIPANIAEGNSRGSRRDYARFVSISMGSLAETETYVLLAIELGFIDRDHALPSLELMDEIGRMLNTLRKRLLLKSSP